MFENAIKEAAKYTRPIHTLVRHYKSQSVKPSAATLFFVNDEGWAITCKHVASTLVAADNITKKYREFSKKASKLDKPFKVKILEKKFGYKKGKPIEIKNNFVNCIEGKLEIDIKAHKNIDLALLHFKNFDKLLCDNFPVFPKDTTTLLQGKMLCRLGYPFAEYNNFKYDKSTDSMVWTDEGKKDSPQFPLDGMLTRKLAKNGKIYGFELSTPGLRGQSGGPVFDESGVVWGVQSMTKHLDLNFDVNIDVIRDGQKKKIDESAILHVGHCIHIDRIKEFLNENDVAFQEK